MSWTMGPIPDQFERVRVELRCELCGEFVSTVTDDPGEVAREHLADAHPSESVEAPPESLGGSAVPVDPAQGWPE